MGPTLMAGAIRRDQRVHGLQDKLKAEAIPELPWHQSGAYLSNALKPEDMAAIREALEKPASPIRSWTATCTTSARTC
jgi:polar amino acid transport system substrate-binding protein